VKSEWQRSIRPAGAHVHAGSAMSEVGAGIVGISSGPRFEIGSGEASGSTIGTGSASATMALPPGS